MPKSTQRVFVFQVVPTLCPQLLPRTTSQVALVKRRQMKVNIFTFTMIVLNLLWSQSEYSTFFKPYQKPRWHKNYGPDFGGARKATSLFKT